MVGYDTIYELSGKFIVGLLILIRVLGMMSAAPLFKNQFIPTQVKIIIGIIITMSMTSTYWEEQPVIDFHLWNMVLLVLKEFLVGLAIGFSANMVFWAARFAGGILDFDMGYQTSLLFNEESAPTLIGELKDVATLMVYLVINGHHYLLEGIYASIRAVPLTTFTITESTIELLIKITLTVFIIGIKIAAPVLVALFLVNLALALLARIAPQTNIFILSFQAKIAVGLIILFITVPLFIMLVKYSLESTQGEMMKILMSLNPGRV